MFHKQLVVLFVVILVAGPFQVLAHGDNGHGPSNETDELAECRRRLQEDGFVIRRNRSDEGPYTRVIKNIGIDWLSNDELRHEVGKDLKMRRRDRIVLKALHALGLGLFRHTHSGQNGRERAFELIRGLGWENRAKKLHMVSKVFKLLPPERVFTWFIDALTFHGVAEYYRRNPSELRAIFLSLIVTVLRLVIKT